MVSIKFKGKDGSVVEGQIPESWKEVSWSTYCKMQDEAVKDDLDLLAIICGVDVDVIRRTETKEALYILHQIKEILTVDNLNKLVSPVSRFEFAGAWYNIDTIDESTVGQYYDVQMMKEKIQKDHTFIPYMIAIMSLKEGEEYDGQVSLKRAQEFKELDVVVCSSLSAFFLSKWQIYIRDTANYLKENLLQ